MQAPAIAVTGRNVMPAFMGAYRAVAMVDVGGEFVYQNSHGNRLFKSVDHTWCLKSMTPNDNGVETRNGRGSPGLQTAVVSTADVTSTALGKGSLQK